MRDYTDAEFVAAKARIAALHEAGHAVAAIALGGRIPVIEVDGRGDGRAGISRAGLTGRDVAIVAFAGTAAAKRFMPVGETMSVSDRDLARDALGFAGNLHNAAARDRLKWEAEQIVHEHRDAILRVADALVERGQLVDADVRRLMAGSALRDRADNYVDPPPQKSARQVRFERLHGTQAAGSAATAALIAADDRCASRKCGRPFRFVAGGYRASRELCLTCR